MEDEPADNTSLCQHKQNVVIDIDTIIFLKRFGMLHDYSFLILY